jgi:hypothetical protein
MPKFNWPVAGWALGISFTAAVTAAVAVAAVPTSPHPRIWLTPQIVASWQALQSVPNSPVSRAITKCSNAHDDPEDYASGQFQSSRWVEAVDACLVAYKTTGSSQHRDTAIKYWTALIDDADNIGDGDGPCYPDACGTPSTFGIAQRDDGYSMRNNVTWAALGYDWLYNDLTPALRARYDTRFQQWQAFALNPDAFERDDTGSNYNAGHVIAITLMAIGHADEMDAAKSGTGTMLWNHVANDVWGQIMAHAIDIRRPMHGGDWAEGWEYGPLSVAEISLAGRAVIQQGVTLPWVRTWLHELLYRYIYALTPDNRLFIGGDVQNEAPTLEADPLPLYGLIAGPAAAEDKAKAKAEITRLALPVPNLNGDFTLLTQSLAAADTTPAKAINRNGLAPSYLAAGAGNFYARTGFGPNDIWMVSQCRGAVSPHQHLDAGNVTLDRGADALLVDPTPYGSLSTLTGNAPTMSQPSYRDAEYRPSQADWGETSAPIVLPLFLSTRFVSAGSGVSKVSATQCNYLGQFRFQDDPSTTVAGTVRDVVLLPGTTGASMLIRDMIHTTADWTKTKDPMLLRFHSMSAFTPSIAGDQARAVVGGSALVIRRLFGAAITKAESVPVGDCFSGPHGACVNGRFASFDWNISVPGPTPSTIHLLDADDRNAVVPTASSIRTGSIVLTSVLREGRQYYVASHTVVNATITAYDAPAVDSTQIVLDPPAGARVMVTATLDAASHKCHFTLAATSSTTEGLTSKPLAMHVTPACLLQQ